jgi:glycosyltransferase involved in cell wall biosynthesis
LRTSADVYHVHYLLQDCYTGLRLGKRPLIGHAHGSDVRTTLNHPIWGRVVKHNLRGCDKVLVSTPDIIDAARRFREDAEYLPNPVDLQLFHPKPPQEGGGRKRVLIASDSNWRLKELT